MVLRIKFLAASGHPLDDAHVQRAFHGAVDVGVLDAANFMFAVGIIVIRFIEIEVVEFGFIVIKPVSAITL